MVLMLLCNLNTEANQKHTYHVTFYTASNIFISAFSGIFTPLLSHLFILLAFVLFVLFQMYLP